MTRPPLAARPGFRLTLLALAVLGLIVAIVAGGAVARAGAAMTALTLGGWTLAVVSLPPED